ncbi:MAG: transcriptional repressor NrdR [Acidimicrobiaceae bacterium]
MVADTGYGRVVRCPGCSSLEDKVVDSRTADEGAAIRRRRECLDCGRRFTTYERLEEAPVVVLKQSGGREPFSRAKIAAGVLAAAKNRPVSAADIEALVVEVEESLRLEGPELTSARIGLTVLERLRALDQVAYLRFASVYKGFEGPGDFEREMGLLMKHEPPPPPPAGS